MEITLISRNFSVYKHTVLANGKCYIGITNRKPSYRWGRGSGYLGQILFYNAILKYGWDNIKHEILFTGLSKEQAEQKEIELIAEYKSNNRKFGYNIANGGNHIGKQSKETILKISLANSIPILQFSKTGEFIVEYSSTAEAERMTGFSKIKDCVAGIKKTAGGYIWIKKSNADKISGLVKNIKPIRYGGKESKQSKQVKQLDRDGNVIQIFDSLGQAAKAIGVHKQKLCDACKGRRNRVRGYRWQYAS